MAFVNIGGIANVTYVDPRLPPEEGLLAFDCGIGNAMGDDLVFARTGQSYDNDGKIAGKGVIDQNLLSRWMSHAFFSQKPPKSLDRMDFMSFASDLDALSLEDALATVNAFTVQGIEHARAYFPRQVEKLIICGGGRKNVNIMKQLGAQAIDDFGLDGDMTEAEAFAYLAYLHLEQLPMTFQAQHVHQSL